MYICRSATAGGAVFLLDTTGWEGEEVKTLF